jgi:hypothetical protein
MDEVKSRANEENIRTEYTALNSYGSLVVSFRFTLVGFFVAAVGLIAAVDFTKEKAALLLWLSIVLWLLELRNRSLLSNLSERSMQIERQYWGYRGLRAYDPFVSHQNKLKPDDDPDAGDPPGPDSTKILFWRVRLKIISHTIALDLLYLGVIGYTIYKLFSH